MGDHPKTRVLHIITRLILGGAQENTLLTVIGQQRTGRYDVVLLAGIDDGPEGTLHDEAARQGVSLVLTPWLVRPINPFKDVGALLILYRLIRQGRFDVVHTHSSKAGILGRIAARLAGVPVVIHTLHSLVFHEYQSRLRNWLYILLKRLCAPLTDCYISVCDATTRGALQQGIGSADRYVTVYSGIDLTPFLEISETMTAEQAKIRLGLNPSKPVVGKVARLMHQKGHDLFLRAASRIICRQPDVQFLLVGDGILRQSLERMADDLGVRARVTFAGLVKPEDVPAYMRAMDVVVHTSIREGVARVIPQAYAVGSPVVALNLDGAPEVIENGLNGFLIDPGDEAAVADAVEALLRSQDLRKEMVRRGREVVLKRFPVHVMVEAINRVYEMLLVRKGGRTNRRLA
ncbi:MAG: glycosyltransferase family 1 protein [Desulfobacteraceae bacterium]|nr:MAG: glycosyltransferase family 1 protein [Desulfobacteraceae bacterium]